MQTARVVPQHAHGSYLMGPSRLGAFRHPLSFRSRPPHHHHDVLQRGHGTHIKIRARARAWRVARAPKSFPPPPRAHPARMERPNRAWRRNRTITRQSSPWCASKRPRAPPRAWCNRKSCDFATSRSAAATAMPLLWTVRVLVTRRAQQVKQPQHHRRPGGGPWRGARVGGQVNLPFPRYTYSGCFIGRSVPL